MGLSIEVLVHKDAENNLALQQFLKEKATIFQQMEFLNAVGNDLEVAVAYQDDRIIAALPQVITKKYGLRASHIPRYGYTYGPVVSNEIGKDHFTVVSAMLEKVRKQPLAEWKLLLPDNDILTYNQLGASVMVSQTHIVNHNADFGPASIHSSKRRYLKKLLKALDNGDIILHEGRGCKSDLLRLQAATGEKSGFNSSQSVLTSIMDSLNDDQAYSLVLSTPEGNLLSGAYCPFDANSAYHLVNASMNHKDNLLNRSNILATYLAISKAMTRGLNFDFEGSNIPGVANYYRLMGGEPTLMYRIQIPRSLVGKIYFSAIHMK